MRWACLHDAYFTDGLLLLIFFTGFALIFRLFLPCDVLIDNFKANDVLILTVSLATKIRNKILLSEQDKQEQHNDNFPVCKKTL